MVIFQETMDDPSRCVWWPGVSEPNHHSGALCTEEEERTTCKNL